MESPKGTPSFSDEWGATYRLVEPGSFVFGDPTGKGHPSEQPSCNIDVSNPFFLGERPVTQAHWSDVMGQNPSKFQEGWSAGLRPVEQIDMYDVEQFLQHLNQREEGVLRLGLRGKWRLPTEVEWEYAARAGTHQRWSFGYKDAELDGFAWHAGNSGGTTREVGTKDANPWGFFDLNGLVNEWCSDHWSKTLEGGRTQLPWKVESSRRFVVRGGAWFTESDSTRDGARSFADVHKRSDGLGVRLVWEPLDQQD